MNEVKKPTSYSEQLEILKSRGCIIDDEDRCVEILSHVGYYRFTAYLLQYKQDDNKYINSPDFSNIYKIYEFDRKLRNILYSAIEIVEVNLRASLSYYHAHKYGALGYLEQSSFSKRHNAEKFKENINREIENNKKVPFVRHHIDNYDGKFPIWVIGELFTFGMWSYFYSDLNTSDKKILVGKNYENVESWLRCCTDLRNICAHYGRLYNRKFTAIPKNLGLNETENRSLWGAILSLYNLYPSKDKWNSEIVKDIMELFDSYEDVINLECISFPLDWKEKILKTENFNFDVSTVTKR